MRIKMLKILISTLYYSVAGFLTDIYGAECAVTQLIQEDVVRKLYSAGDSGSKKEFDLSNNKAFSGGYINFGYWKDIDYSDPQTLTEIDRIKASENLYKVVFEKLEPKIDDKILEVGCGRGYGALCLYSYYPMGSFLGIDLTPDQINIAKKDHKLCLNPKFSFEVGAAHSIPRERDHFTKIYSVEAIQHFYSVDDFAKEASRVLVSKGRIVITSHLPTSEEGYKIYRDRIPVINSYQDPSTPVSDVREAFKRNGFEETCYESIGKDVFEGMDSWRSKINDVSWTRDLLNLFKEGHLDYYILVYIKK